MTRLLWTLLMLLILMVYFKAHAENRLIKVAVIDTGFGYSGSNANTKHLCKSEHVDLTSKQVYSKYDNVGFVPLDSHGHGTNIAGIIDNNLKNENYCLVIIKYWASNEYNDENSLKAIAYATKIHADIINYSGGGTAKDEKEVKLVKAYLDQGGIFVAAAGNEKMDLTVQGYYPAMDDPRVKVVGAIDTDGDKATFSNFGKRVNFWEIGEKVEGNGLVLSGTSQATAVETAKFVHRIWVMNNAN